MAVRDLFRRLNSPHELSDEQLLRVVWLAAILLILVALLLWT